ncbi:MAG: DNA repair protein RecN [Candidatus Liberibacter europaeus]|uniref:DNA repair protein RecN n=1 Tax=Candidatus Liberibacter europaeus TaxID=744859 RepID=A0A2T4VYD2_9HYPH|nr:DNA repair protein RecN [Candidatus Liberibacter europaeus]PTL86785.1 MAG: DNA repair protein RecN [Candidatus Liberibacter europaeus]
MLIRLSIRNIVLIDSLDIDFSAGLSILSGETGSGKSVLLDAIFLAIGCRGDGGLVRRNSEKGQVIAIFDTPNSRAIKDIFEEANITLEDNLILRRVQFSDGRTKAYINDQLVSINFMRSVGSLLLEIHSQHAERFLLDISGHRKILDSYAGIEEDLHNLEILYRNWCKSLDALRDYNAQTKTSTQDIDFLRFAVQELQDINVKLGEESELSKMRSSILKQEKIAVDLTEMIEEFNKSSSPISVVSSILRRIERKNFDFPDSLNQSIHYLNEALDNLSDAQQEMEKVLSEIKYDSQELENIEERLFSLRAISRKYSVPVDDIPNLTKKMITDLTDISACGDKICSFEQDIVEARKSYDHAAQDISAKRRQFAQKLEKNVMAELPALKLEGVRFMVNIISDMHDISPNGIDKVEFYVQTNVGENPGPLMKLASGGELSRFLLALKIALFDYGSVPTLVFDEVDSGIGGAVADAIGHRLKQLSENTQLLVITHAPQVAARADTHFLVDKRNNPDDPERIITYISTLSKKERCEEIARMLAGVKITDEARAAAKKLLDLN